MDFLKDTFPKAHTRIIYEVSHGLGRAVLKVVLVKLAARVRQAHGDLLRTLEIFALSFTNFLIPAPKKLH